MSDSLSEGISGNGPSILIVYHKSSDHLYCDDGFAAAFAAWLHFKDKAIYLPAIHGQEIPIERFQSKMVFFLDFSYDLPIMQKIEAVSDSLVVIDHHKSVIDQAKDHPAFSESSIDHSGCVLAWYYFHDPNRLTPLPLLFAHIEDNDLWRNQLTDTRAFIQRLRLEPYQFEHWEKLLATLQNDQQKNYQYFVEQGRLLQRQIIKQCESLVHQAFWVTLAGVRGLAVNANRAYASELGQMLAEQSGTFAAIFVVLPEGLIDVSLRSNKSGCDVSLIAQAYGGGGHVRAAGFRFRDHSLLKRILV